MRILITGITGFMGSHLAGYLIENGHNNISGVIRSGSDRISNIDFIESKLDLHECDLLDAATLELIISKVKPDLVFHLASELPRANFTGNPVNMYLSNIVGTLNLLESVRAHSTETKIIMAGSSREYGAILPDECPVKEDHPLNPADPYALSKTAQFFMGYEYFKHFGMKIFFARVFYLTGPGQPDGFVCSSIARQAVLVKKGLSPNIVIGNREVRRDFVDVRDVANALYLISEGGRPGEVYNVCSVKGHRIEDVLNIIKNLLKMDNVTVYTEPSLTRKNESPVITGDNSKISSETGWSPLITLEKSLEDLLRDIESRTADKD